MSFYYHYHESFTYLGSVVDKLGGTDADVKVRIGKARAAFHQLRKVWGSSELPRNTKIRIFMIYGKSLFFCTVKRPGEQSSP